MTLKAEVYQFRWSRRWYWVVYDTDQPSRGLASGRTPADEWRQAYDAAHRAVFLLRFRPIQERINATTKALAAVYPVHRHVIDPTLWDAAKRPPEPMTWEGDYA